MKIKPEKTNVGTFPAQSHPHFWWLMWKISALLVQTCIISTLKESKSDPRYRCLMPITEYTFQKIRCTARVNLECAFLGKGATRWNLHLALTIVTTEGLPQGPGLVALFWFILVASYFFKAVVLSFWCQAAFKRYGLCAATCFGSKRLGSHKQDRGHPAKQIMRQVYLFI